jgi:hypothetical protein
MTGEGSASLPHGYVVGFDPAAPGGDATAVVARHSAGVVHVEIAIRGVRAFQRAVRVVQLKVRWLGFVSYRHVRPDGRPRRSGHRHRGYPRR